MSKKICISIPEWVWEKYLINQKNKSGYILEMIIKGMLSKEKEKENGNE